MNTVVAIPTEFGNARAVCNLIQEQKFESYKKLRDYLTGNILIDKYHDQQPQFFSLCDFMEECNDQLFNFEGTFISYCEVGKKE